MFKSQNGFTLIEAMIVIAIIGILAAIIVPCLLIDKPDNDNINHGLSTDVEYPSAQDALITMENAGFHEPAVTHVWEGEMKESPCARSDRTAYDIVAKDATERQRTFLVCCRGTHSSKSCSILRQANSREAR